MVVALDVIFSPWTPILADGLSITGSTKTGDCTSHHRWRCSVHYRGSVWRIISNICESYRVWSSKSTTLLVFRWLHRVLSIPWKCLNLMFVIPSISKQVAWVGSIISFVRNKNDHHPHSLIVYAPFLFVLPEPIYQFYLT